MPEHSGDTTTGDENPWDSQENDEHADDGFDDLRHLLGIASISNRMRAHLNKIVDELGEPGEATVTSTGDPDRPVSPHDHGTNDEAATVSAATGLEQPELTARLNELLGVDESTAGTVTTGHHEPTP